MPVDFFNIETRSTDATQCLVSSSTVKSTQSTRKKKEIHWCITARTSTDQNNNTIRQKTGNKDKIPIAIGKKNIFSYFSLAAFSSVKIICAPRSSSQCLWWEKTSGNALTIWNQMPRRNTTTHMATHETKFQREEQPHTWPHMHARPHITTPHPPNTSMYTNTHVHKHTCTRSHTHARTHACTHTQNRK